MPNRRATRFGICLITCYICIRYCAIIRQNRWEFLYIPIAYCTANNSILYPMLTVFDLCVKSCILELQRIAEGLNLKRILLIPYPLSLTPYPLLLTPYSLPLTPYSLLLTPYPLPLTPYPLSLTPYPLPLFPNRKNKKTYIQIFLLTFAPHRLKLMC